MSLITPIEFKTLTNEQQSYTLEILKRQCGYTLEKEIFLGKELEVTSIFRPIREDFPTHWKFYLPYIHKAFPEGEKRRFIDSDSIQNTYKHLYGWKHGGCAKCGATKEDVIWDEGDKHICLFCKKCYNEEPFIKHCRAYI